MINNIKIINQDTLELIGFVVHASLNQDISQNLVLQLRQHLLSSKTLKKDAKIYLIQKYPDEEWTPDLIFTHIVATEKNNFDISPENSITEVIPAGKFISFKYEGPEAEIDLAYDFIRDWLKEQKMKDNRTYDLENWGTRDNLASPQPLIHLLIPFT